MTGRPAAASVIARVRPPPSCPWRGPAVILTAPTVSRGAQHQGATSTPMTSERTPVRLIHRNPATPEARMNVPPPAPRPAAAGVGAHPTRGRGLAAGPIRMAGAAAPGPLTTAALRLAATARKGALRPPTPARPAVPGSATTPSAAVPATIRAPVESAFVSAARRMAGPQPGGRAARLAGDPAATEPVPPPADPVEAATVRPADPQTAADRGVARAAPAANPPAAAVPAAATAAGPAAEPDVGPVGAPAGHRVSGLRPPVRPWAEMGWAVPTAFPVLPGARSMHREPRWCRAGGLESRQPGWHRLEGQQCTQQSVRRLDLSPAPVERSARRPCWRST
ncbi:MAG: hypothetical protein QOD41_2847 [Cryptosporangiaceae bacterium]|jgi:hypothetical protein|nr:hypothetical protein [Cryptosporangiaceae bacterium]